MVRNILVSLVAATSIAFTMGAFAAKPITNEVKPAMKTSATSIQLYAKPQGQQIKSLPANAHLVPIVQRGDWVKVGDQSNGDVGWINWQQYQKARQAYFRPNEQTFFINVMRDADGKPTVNVIAYKNGKKLTEQQAHKLYQQMRLQQQQQYQKIRQINSSMNRLFSQDMEAAQDLFSSILLNNQWMMPRTTYPMLPPLKKDTLPVKAKPADGK